MHACVYPFFLFFTFNYYYNQWFIINHHQSHGIQTRTGFLLLGCHLEIEDMHDRYSLCYIVDEMIFISYPFRFHRNSVLFASALQRFINASVARIDDSHVSAETYFAQWIVSASSSTLGCRNWYRSLLLMTLEISTWNEISLSGLFQLIRKVKILHLPNFVYQVYYFERNYNSTSL